MTAKKTYRVRNYVAGHILEGVPSPLLIEQSLKSEAGAVLAFERHGFWFFAGTSVSPQHRYGPVVVYVEEI